MGCLLRGGWCGAGLAYENGRPLPGGWRGAGIGLDKDKFDTVQRQTKRQMKSGCIVGCTLLLYTSLGLKVTRHSAGLLVPDHHSCRRCLVGSLVA